MDLPTLLSLIFSVLGTALALACVMAPSAAAWRRLARIYPDQPCLAERTFHSVSGQPGGRQTLTLSACPTGLRVSTVRIFWRLMPPFFVPWSEVTRCERARQYFSPEGLRFEIARWSQPL